MIKRRTACGVIREAREWRRSGRRWGRAGRDRDRDGGGDGRALRIGRGDVRE